MKKSSALQNLQTEIDTSYLYTKLAETEDDPAIAKLYHAMAAIEIRHAETMVKSNKEKGITVELPNPSWRAKMLNRIGKVFGYVKVFFWYGKKTGMFCLLSDLEKAVF